MKKTIMHIATVALAALPAAALAQSKKPDVATFITKEEVEAVNKTAGTDRTIKVVDIGSEHFAVGVIHRGPIPAPPGGVASPTPAANSTPCGVADANAPKDLTPGLTHEKQTEGYYIISGEGTLATGGHIVNGRNELADSDVVTTLNGPSCRGGIGGADVVMRFVKTGDIVIIPPGVPHGWSSVKDHVDYVSFRPSGNLLAAGYENPAIKK